ncbi:Zinc finger CCHC domain-containing 8 [Gossypium australe]|uniref:Zinc finger CCHC domain-containing 8 n=1 Tax=Gossypium australe TaxID=47621 RepID=A0A5B6WII5_9ROSI|nr:Zinc finger CCHC domain-containing 8 [Gossypium australe]
MVEYEAEFLRLSRYTRGMVVTEYERCVRFEDESRTAYGRRLRRRLSALSTKIVRKAKSDGPVRVGPPVAPSGVAFCRHCGRRHSGKCWRMTRACLRCGSTEHRVRDCPLRTDQAQATGTGAA